ncbi:MAG: pantoate--beta-alanine ligase [Phycisphaerales bacterium]
MIVVTDAAGIERAALALSGAEALGGVLVPTMGALHDGHAALIHRAAELAGRDERGAGCVVSIFVNPAQFNDPADYERYPRTLDADLRLCEAAGASVVFAPPASVVYPPGMVVEQPLLPGVATTPGLEDAHRPGHFAGVCRVVLRLFRLLRPDAAVFGEKDWQQLQVVSAMTESLALPIRIEPHATIREADGLALSSRNRFLSADERRRAVALARALCEAAAAREPADAEDRMRRVLTRAGVEAEYAAVRDAATLDAPQAARRACRALIAVRLGGTRLIDNAPWVPA